MATKRRINWKLVIPLGICLILILYLAISLLVSLFVNKTDPNVYKICSYTGAQTLAKVKEEDKSAPVEVKDFNIYGEHLNLYLSSYDILISDADSAVGDTLVLTDLCSGQQKRYSVTGLADSGIDLAGLDNGFYAVYLQQGSTMQRVYMDTALAQKAGLITASRNGSRRQVSLIAQQNLFDQPDQVVSTLDNSYLYIKVESYQPAGDTAAAAYDVVINTAPYIVTTADTKNPTGLTINGINQAAELYDMALRIKTQLESSGINVLILKSSAADATDFYGENGLLQAAYNSRACYMINLDFAQLQLGSQVHYSLYSSSDMAACIETSLAAVSGLNMNSTPLLAGNAADDYQYDVSGTKVAYDEFYEIREAGGQQLLAGTISSNSQRNASFAAGNPIGLQAVTVYFGSINNADEVKFYNNNKDSLAAAVAAGFVSYLNR